MIKVLFIKSPTCTLCAFPYMLTQNIIKDINEKQSKKIELKAIIVQKDELEKERKKYDFNTFPTIIIYKNEKEVERITNSIEIIATIRDILNELN